MPHPVRGLSRRQARYPAEKAKATMNASKLPTRSPGRGFLVAAVILVLGTVAAGMYLSAAWGCTLALLPAVGACAGTPCWSPWRAAQHCVPLPDSMSKVGRPEELRPQRIDLRYGIRITRCSAPA
jgi:hypothetical protein